MAVSYIFFWLNGFSCTQIVFRSDPGKFKDLKLEFGEFHNRVMYLVEDLIKNIEIKDLQKMIDEVCNWQVWCITDDEL